SACPRRSHGDFLGVLHQPEGRVRNLARDAAVERLRHQDLRGACASGREGRGTASGNVGPCRPELTVSIAGVRRACAREIAFLRAHPWDLALISWFPALVMAITWAIFAQGVNVKLPLAFVDEDHSPGSRRLATALEAVRSVAIAERPSTLEEA